MPRIVKLSELNKKDREKINKQIDNEVATRKAQIESTISFKSKKKSSTDFEDDRNVSSRLPTNPNNRIQLPINNTRGQAYNTGNFFTQKTTTRENVGKIQPKNADRFMQETGAKGRVQSQGLPASEISKEDAVRQLLSTGTSIKYGRRVGDTVNNILTTAQNLKSSAKTGIMQFGRTFNERLVDRQNYSSMRTQAVANILSEKGDEEDKEKAKGILKGYSKLNGLKYNEGNNSIEEIKYEDANKDLLEKINEENQDMQNRIEQSTGLGKITSEFASSLGNNLVGIGVSAVNPAAGLTYFVGSSTGSYEDDAKARGMEGDRAKLYSGIMGAIEGIGDYFVGFGAFGRGLSAIGKKNAGKAIAKFGETMIGSGIENAAQEGLTEPVNELVAAATGGKDKASWDNMGQRIFKSAGYGFLSGLIFDGIGHGVGRVANIQNKINNGENISQTDIQNVVKDLENSGMSKEEIFENAKNSALEAATSELQRINSEEQSIQQTQGIQQSEVKENLRQSINENSTLSKQDKNQMLDYIDNNYITEADNLAMKQTLGIEEQENVEDNRHSNDVQEQNNGVKEELLQRIEKSTLSNEDKAQMIDYIRNNELSDADQVAMNQVIDNAVTAPANNELVTNQNYKDNVEARKKYAQYKNDTGEYNSKVVDEVLDVTPINRNGRRTVKQWLGAAQEIGTRIADLSNEEIERIAYKSWFDNEPSKNITKYDNQTKSNVGFQKLTSDEWINSINKGVNEARTNNQVQEDQNNSVAIEEEKQKRLEHLKNIDTSEMGLIERGKIKTEIRALEQGYNSIEEYQEAERLKREQAKKEYEQRQKEKENIESQKKLQLEKDIKETTPMKNAQFEIIQKTNPMLDDYHTGIRTPKDIKTFDEVIKDEESFVWGDFSREDAQKALQEGKITIYSSYPIENGTFVSTSKKQAEDYAGGRGNKVYSQEVPLNEVAWISGDEGQYAKVIEGNQNILPTNLQNKIDVDQDTEQNKPNIINEKVNNYISEVKDNFNTDINIETKSLNDGNISFIDYSKVNQSGLAKKAQSLVDKFKTRVFKNNNEDIYVSNRDIGKSISETLRNNEQRPYKLENLAVFSQLDKIIKNGKEISYQPIDSKGRKYYSDYKYYVSNAYIDEKPYVVEFDTRLQKGTKGNLERHFRLERVYPINRNEVVSNAVPKNDNMLSNETTSNNSIPFLKENVNTTNKSMQNTENNTPSKTVLEKTDESVLKVKLQPDEKMPSNLSEEEHIAKILEKPQEQVKKKSRTWAIFKANFIDKGLVFEDISRKANNRELQGKYDYTLTASARGQNAIGSARYEFDNTTHKQKQVCKSLTDIIEEVGENSADFNNYMYHQLNIDRMTLDERLGKENKPVFAKGMTADKSRNIVAELEAKHPEYKEYAQDVYDFLDANTQELVDNGVISKETQELFKKMYPHWVPIKRVTDKGEAISLPLDTKRTGVNAPIKRAKGGNSDIYPLFQTMAERTLQTYKASARNSFGVELKNTLDKLNSLNQNTEATDIDTIMENMTVEEQNNELLQEGKGNEPPTFTVFENGKKVTYQINEDMYDALKPKNELLSKLDNTLPAKAARKISNFRRGVLTEYNPVFMVTNAVKDAQDVLMNSQHAGKTYAKFPEAVSQILGKGYWYNEYIQNGGEQNSYFTEGDFIKEEASFKNKTKNVLTMPLEAISKVNNIIEMTPRLSEYIASREAGRSIETSMLDASRVTTNFKAGGDVTKFINRNGATFLNASVQGMQQQIRNIQEANMKGLKGWVGLACKTAIAGAPALILNNLIWDDDDDYEELSDYVRDNYYIIGKLPNGNFLRIPKGRTTATIQKILSNGGQFIKDSKNLDIDELASRFFKDIKEDIEFTGDNLAPNNPLDNNIVSPIIQAITNKTWYGDDLVPTRLQDKPSREQFDESTDKFSKWLGDKTGISPIKINYLLDQYSGGIGDVLLPMGTPQAENNVIEDKFTTNPVMKNRNPGDLFEKADELKILSNSDNAKDEDILRYKFISGVSSNMSELYKEKREVQNSNDTDKVKKEKILEIQKEINKLAKNGLKDVDTLKTDGKTATIGDKKYYKKDGKWKELKGKETEKTKDMSLSSYSDYQNKVYELTEKKKQKGEKVKFADKVQILLDSKYSDKDKEELYANYVSTIDKTYDSMKKTGLSIDEYLEYKTQDFTADKDKNGKSIMGSRKKKTYNYVNNMNIDYGQKLILLGSQYHLQSSEKKAVAKYVNSLDLSVKDKMKIYEKIKGFTVGKNNTVSWK